MVKLGDVLLSMEALRTLLSMELPLPTSYKLMKLARSLEGELQTFETLRGKVIEKYSVDGVVPPEKVGEVEKELAPLLEERVGVSIPRITIEELGVGGMEGMKGIKIKPSALASLSWLIGE